MIQTQTFSYPSADGLHTVQARAWLPEGSPKAVVQIVHGVAEHVGRYEEAAHFLAGHGFAVCGNDHLGHGRTARRGSTASSPPRGAGSWRSGTCGAAGAGGERWPGLPFFILGHSMGSFLTRTYLIRWPGTVDGAVLSGTGQEPAPVVAFGRAAAGLLCALRGPRYVSPLIYRLSLGAYNRKFRPNRTTGDWLSRDEAMVDEAMADPCAPSSPPSPCSGT